MNKQTSSNSHWTKEQVEFIKKYYPNNGTSFCANKLNKSEASIRHKVHRLNIKIDRILSSERHSEKLIKKFDDSGKQIVTIDTWKKRVFMRDNWTCKDCGLFCPTIIVAHHLKERTSNPELKFNVSNGISLCPNCHSIRHYKQGRKYSANRLTVFQKRLIKEFIQKGYSIAKIATELCISEKTVVLYR